MDNNGSDNTFENWARQTDVVRSHTYRQESERLFEGLRSALERIDDALIEEFGPAVQFDASGRASTFDWEDE